MAALEQSRKTKPVVLCILDGWGERETAEHNAVRLAKTPVMDRLTQTWPKTSLSASGDDVGLPAGQIGNSEVGHLNLGAGRLVLQTLPRITKAVEEGSLKDLPAFKNFVADAKKGSGRVHLMGLLSAGGVHSHSSHAAYLCKQLKAEGLSVCLHAFADGRDGPAKEIGPHLREIEAQIDQSAATLTGRYFAMDRDRRWERTKQAFDLIVHGKLDQSQKQPEDFQSTIEAWYDEGTSDEFLPGVKQPDYEGIKEGDAVLAFNLRADRMRQILAALVDPDFADFPTNTPNLSAALGMISYSDDLSQLMGVLFSREDIKETLGEVVALNGLEQIRAAETEKYPHVTYFLNGGREEPFQGEHRLMVPSPKVATYDLQPEMSAPELTTKLIDEIRRLEPALTVVNFANPDMVGHTGDLQACIRACETVDTCLGQLEALVQELGGRMLVLADHGNCETMQTETGKPHTAHTLNPVPCVAVGWDQSLRDKGRLADVAPTLLELLGIEQPKAMDGTSLLMR